uniref:Transmembrane protein 232 n=1 Tax=Chrysemys picta bellii TaxID=8478 RepID=A0A8C3P6F9_CHRPI
MLARCKRRSGLGTLGSGKHVDLPVAWTEAIILAQCKGEIQEEALDILLISLDHAPMNPEHVPVLFFIAESILYRICCDAAQKSYLYSSEIKLSKSFLDSDPSVQLKLEQKENMIQHFLWHSLVVWVCVHNNSSRLDEVLQHLLFYKEELHQKNWLDSVLGLLVLGEAAKLNLSCLKVLMDLVRDFISSSVSLQKQKDNCMKNLSSWHWEIGYIYTTVLRDICLSGITSDLQKTAFLGFCDCTKPPKHPEELSGASFFDFLHYSPSHDPHDCEELFWVIRYGVVYNLVVMCNELCGDASREGLRNAVWKALQKQKNNEKDSRVLEAIRVAEAEANGPANPFISSSANAPSSPRTLTSCQYVGWRVASVLSQVYLPPIGPNVPLPSKPKQKLSPMPYQHLEQCEVEKKTACSSLREELLQARTPIYPYPDILTRTDRELKKIIEDQWQKELQIRLKEEEELLEKELQEKQRKEEEHFREIMKRREEKLHKKTKPYELPVKHKAEDLIQ